METVTVTEVFTFCKKNGIDMQKSETNIWLYKDGKLLRTFITNSGRISLNDWKNWKRKMGYGY